MLPDRHVVTCRIKNIIVASCFSFSLEIWSVCLLELQRRWYLPPELFIPKVCISYKGVGSAPDRDSISFLDGRMLALSSSSSEILCHGAFGKIYKVTAASEGNGYVVKNEIAHKVYQVSTPASRTSYVIKYICKRKALDVFSKLGSTLLPDSEAFYHFGMFSDTILPCWETEETKDEIRLVLPYAICGNAMDLVLRGESKCMMLVRQFYEDVHDALSYIQERSLVHRDVKLENILVDLGSDAVANFRLMDFGFATVGSPLHGCATFIGTLVYMAADIFLCKHFNIPYGFQADVWSFGIALYIFAVCEHPILEGRLEQQICMADIEYDDLWNCVPPQIQMATAAMLMKSSWLRLRLPFRLKAIPLGNLHAARSHYAEPDPLTNHS